MYLVTAKGVNMITYIGVFKTENDIIVKHSFIALTAYDSILKSINIKKKLAKKYNKKIEIVSIHKKYAYSKNESFLIYDNVNGFNIKSDYPFISCIQPLLN